MLVSDSSSKHVSVCAEQQKDFIRSRLPELCPYFILGRWIKIGQNGNCRGVCWLEIWDAELIQGIKSRERKTFRTGLQGMGKNHHRHREMIRHYIGIIPMNLTEHGLWYLPKRHREPRLNACKCPCLCQRHCVQTIIRFLCFILILAICWSSHHFQLLAIELNNP